MELRWTEVEKSRGNFDFESPGYVNYVNQMLSAMPPVRPYFILDYGNPLYDNACFSSQKHDGTCPPTSDMGREAFANFTVAAMRQWRGKGIVWEIWNVSAFSGTPTPAFKC